MKILEEFPPNFKEIEKVFPNLEKSKPIFSYGDTIYNPYKAKVTPDLEVHEAVHGKQQKGDPKTWWGYYLVDPEFRLSQETEAYGAQYCFLKETIKIPKITDWYLDKISLSLSGELYGNMLNYAQAKSRIRNFYKNYQNEEKPTKG